LAKAVWQTKCQDEARWLEYLRYRRANILNRRGNVDDEKPKKIEAYSCQFHQMAGKSFADEALLEGRYGSSFKSTTKPEGDFTPPKAGFLWN
jgi:hypothetical protein